MDIETEMNLLIYLLDIRDKYQYFTQAEMQKIRSIGYVTPFHSLLKG